MALPPESVKQRTYNVTAMSFTPDEIAKSVQRHVPDLQVTYKPDWNGRQLIGMSSIENQYCNKGRNFILQFMVAADSWPQVFDDSEARAEWNWKPQYDIDGMVDIMIDALKPKYHRQ